MKKRIFSLMLMFTVLISQVAFGAEFSDVPSEHWAHSVIDELSDKGIINGMGDGSYAPDATLTRAQFIKLLTVAIGDYDADKDYEPVFYDTASGEWYTPYVTCGAQSGILDRNTGFFYPESPVTRGEAAVWIVRGMGIEKDITCNFADVIDKDQKKAVAIAADKGIINGYEDGSFRPDNILTRAEAAALISRTMKNVPVFGQLRTDAANEIVMNDDVKYISIGENNHIKKVDKSGKKVTFSSPCDTVKSLATGDVVYVSGGDNCEDGIFKVTSVKTSGSGITVGIGSPELSEVIESIDISTIVTPSQEELENNENISNVRPSSGSNADGAAMGTSGKNTPANMGSVGGLDIDAGAQISPEAEWKDGKLVWKIPASGNACADFTLQTDSYKTKKGAYASLDMNMSILLDVELSGENFDAQLRARTEVDSNINAVVGYAASKEASKALELPAIEVSVSGPITVEIKPYLVTTASGEFEVEATATLTNTIGFEFADGETQTWSDCNLESSLEANAEGYLEAGPRMSAELGLKDFEFFGIEVDAPEILNFTADMGIGISGKTEIKQKAGVSTEGASYEGHQNTPDENGVIHNCAFCVKGEIYSYDKFTFGLSDDLNEFMEDIINKKLTYESDKMTFTFSPWYYSVGEWGAECELATCPHKLVRVSGNITEKDTGDSIGGASLKAEAVSAFKDFDKEKLADDKTEVADSSGKYEIFLEPGVWDGLATEEKHKDTSVSIRVPSDKEITTNIVMELKDIRISGYVTDSKTGTGISGAVVNVGGKSAMSGAGGYYELEIKPLDVYSVGASCDKYSDYTSQIEADKDDITLNIALEPVDNWKEAYRSIIKKEGKYNLVELADLNNDDIPELLVGNRPGSGGFSGFIYGCTLKDGKVETITGGEYFQIAFKYERYRSLSTGEHRVEGNLSVRSGIAEASGSTGIFKLSGNELSYSPVHGWYRLTTESGGTYRETYTYYGYTSGKSYKTSEAEYNSTKANMHNGWVKDDSFKFAMVYFGKNVTDSEINKLYEDYDNGVE